ncbi:hypothetical protein [uncultured Agitococcus sp.]|uniref:hypothetical protein n=1 Tax=uncultured Agitococcus sp. TaxID=1506599 RepID=UPI0026174FC2|nr:hypothetical protein [uncultured Agitococcus sp.]
MIQNECFRKYLAEVEKTGKLKNNELYRLALYNDKRAIKYIPYDEQTAEMALMAVNGSPHSLRFVAALLHKLRFRHKLPLPDNGLKDTLSDWRTQMSETV